jgi:hypothetical protein
MKRRSFIATTVLFSALAASACAGDAKDTTTGKRILLATRVEPDSSAEDEFTTGTKWTVQLKSAALAIGGLYYFDGTPAFAMRERPSPWQRLGSLLIGVAHAHPQHYVAGGALGEMVEPSSVDLLRGARLAEGEGVTGTFRSGRVALPQTVGGPAADELRGHVASASGVARQGDKSVYFHVFAELADIQQTSPSAEIDGCVFDEVDVTADGTVTLTVKPSVWFNLVDFSGVDSGSEDEPTEIAAGVAHKAFALGVAQLSAYHFSYRP